MAKRRLHFDRKQHRNEGKTQMSGEILTDCHRLDDYRRYSLASRKGANHDRD